jgi:hypothetical protein
VSAAAEELAPPASVDTAVTYRCIPRLGHRAWQYDPANKAIPTWVTAWTNTMGDGRLEFTDTGGSTGTYFEPGDWLVEFDEDGYALIFEPKEFAEIFKLVLP